MHSETSSGIIDRPEATSERMTLEVLASRFVEEHRRWLNPSIEAYANACPEYADEIRESFPVLIAMEEWKTNQEFTRLRKQIPADFMISQLGNCRILKEISRNRTSILYAAVQGPHKRKVAVRLLPWKSECSLRLHERFLREACLVFRLRHPNIISVESTEAAQGYAYAVMQLVPGISLDQVLRGLTQKQTGTVYQDQFEPQVGYLFEEQLPQVLEVFRQNYWRSIATLGLQAANALRFAHSRGTLHCDLRPGNFILNQDGHCWLTGFCLPQHLEGTFRQQRVQSLLNQPPERIQGDVDERSDLYSLGCVLYELATLSPIFKDKSSNALVEQILSGSYTRPREINREIPAALENIIIGCLDRSKQNRYQSADELSVSLVRFLNSRAVKSRMNSESNGCGK
ncbi:serine/threonine protein kinase [Gimesia algae]|uniref:Serine/threonine-protein kinase PknH n=1 Tax=Gimesia algae TaxID=2527971 RepID=A0A517VB59_9PLAN|nr:serine/threonine-protein kinase [Gimesia algae]QDT90242.1 Serine/threonine-protein kinase PknH [Gimesia algae]